MDRVAREHQYLAFLEAPPLADVRKFVQQNIAERAPQFVAIVDERVVGWCDALPKPRPALRHSSGRGLGAALLDGEFKDSWLIALLPD